MPSLVLCSGISVTALILTHMTMAENTVLSSIDVPEIHARKQCLIHSLPRPHLLCRRSRTRDKAQSQLQLTVRRRTAECHAISTIHTIDIVEPRHCERSTRRLLRLLHHEGTVHQEQRLSRNRAHIASVDDAIAIGNFEFSKHLQMPIAEH